MGSKYINDFEVLVIFSILVIFYNFNTINALWHGRLIALQGSVRQPLKAATVQAPVATLLAFLRSPLYTYIEQTNKLGVLQIFVFFE